MSEATRRAAGITLATAAAGRVEESLVLTGRVLADPRRVRRVTARYPGRIVSIAVEVGQRVAAGSIVARVESDDSLQTYPLLAPIAGVVTERFGNPGEASGTGPIITVADLAHVRVDVPVFATDLGRIRPGTAVRVESERADGAADTATVAAIEPIGSDASQTTTARIELDNRDGRWTPGMGVRVIARVREVNATVVVPRDAVQSWRGRPVVFVRTGTGFVARPVTVGLEGTDHVAITGGVSAGEQVAARNSYVVRAEFEKPEAEDD